MLTLSDGEIERLRLLFLLLGLDIFLLGVLTGDDE